MSDWPFILGVGFTVCVVLGYIAKTLNLILDELRKDKRS